MIISVRDNSRAQQPVDKLSHCVGRFIRIETTTKSCSVGMQELKWRSHQWIMMQRVFLGESKRGTLSVEGYCSKLE